MMQEGRGAHFYEAFFWTMAAEFAHGGGAESMIYIV